MAGCFKLCVMIVVVMVAISELMGEADAMNVVSAE
jgi:hypothetical protein